MFEIEKEISFPKKEEKVLDFWSKEDIFTKSLEQREVGELFSFYDGPPFATGLPHYGHLLAGTIKDVIPRYKTMKGYYVPRRFGWDCHGLPVENEIEKAFELSGAVSIENFGIAKFNEECRNIVLRYTREWKDTVLRMGRWVDFDRTYRTMDASFMESVWWVFGQIYGQGLVYEGFKVMPFSAKLGTPLSNFEANLNYKDVDDPSIVITFPLLGDEKVSFLAWTTTPWTLPSNLALMVNPKFDYVQIYYKPHGKSYILAKARLINHFKDENDYEIEKTFLGEELKDKPYVPLFDYFTAKRQRGAFRVLLEDSVSLEDGTGIVHCAPAFGEIDFFVCSREGIEIVCPVDHNGQFTKEVPEYEGLFVKDADKDIIKHLKQINRLFSQGQIRHRYPFCWRSDTPLIYKAVTTWFVAVEKIKDKMIANNEKINWIPDNIKHGRFGKWLENARDWAISRNRYWGTPLPIWRSEDGDIVVISSVNELEKRVGVRITDLHRHHIDQLTFTENGKLFKRVPEVFDCWFESGSMPYAQNHYPFENEEETKKSFPADFIAEGLDQTRGWFYTLTVISTILFNEPAFLNVVVNGIILAEDGAKMSKRLKNYPEPGKVINECGADAIRMYLMQSPAVKAEDLRFSERGVEQIIRTVLLPFWNSYSFLATYAKIYNWHPKKLEKDNFDAEIDRWIISYTQRLIKKSSEALDAYDFNEAVQVCVDYIDQLTNWYIRRCRPRFWSEIDSKDRNDAFSALYTALMTFCKVSAPIIPFISDAIFRELREETDKISVHLCDYPTYNAEVRNEKLEQDMKLVQTVVSLGHALRKQNQIRVRQPLAKAFLISCNESILDSLRGMESLIKEELNVKDLVYSKDESSFVSLTLKPNFKVLGKKIGPLMKPLQEAIKKLNRTEIEKFSKTGILKITVEGNDLELSQEDVGVDRIVLPGIVAESSGEVTIALDTEITKDLKIEGMAREIINKINTMRREMELAVEDRIEVVMQTTDFVKESFLAYQDHICHEVLANKITFAQCEGETWDLNGEEAKIEIKVVT